MKKILILLASMLLVLTGCGKFTVDDAKKEFSDDVASSKAYELKGKMEIINDEDTFMYDITVAFKKDEMYRVNLVNNTNNHEQIILKNADAVYVVTPSLNKSFKFQSEWPKNSSQAYLLQALIDDINNDKDLKLEEKDDKYILVTKVNYPNNPGLVEEKIYFSKDMDIEKVEVFNETDALRIKVEFTSVDLKASFAKDYFDLTSIIDEECCKTENPQTGNENTCEEGDETCKTNETTNQIEDIVYPLYIPANTYLTNKDVIDIPGGQRVILTFAGEKNFILVEETMSITPEFEVIPVYGEPLMFNDTVAALSGNSLNWHTKEVDYYLTGDNLSANELLTIATSLSNTTSVSIEK